jgi:hypothetical protein
MVPLYTFQNCTPLFHISYSLIWNEAVHVILCWGSVFRSDNPELMYTSNQSIQIGQFRVVHINNEVANSTSNQNWCTLFLDADSRVITFDQIPFIRQRQFGSWYQHAGFVSELLWKNAVKASMHVRPPLVLVTESMTNCVSRSVGLASHGWNRPINELLRVSCTLEADWLT